LSEPLTYSISEAAEAIGVGRNSAYELVRRGELRSVRVGRRVLIPRDVVREFLGIHPGVPAAVNVAHPREPEEVTYVVTVRRVPLELRRSLFRT
jgi:excisionase family DNA binding protein